MSSDHRCNGTLIWGNELLFLCMPITTSASLGYPHKEGLEMQMFLLYTSSLPTLKTRSSLLASTRETFASHSWCFWGAIFPWPPTARRCFPKLFSRDVVAGYQHKLICLRQIVISPETDVGCDRKRQKLPRNVSIPLPPWAARRKWTCRVPQESCLSEQVQDSPFSQKSKGVAGAGSK